MVFAIVFFIEIQYGLSDDQDLGIDLVCNFGDGDSPFPFLGKVSVQLKMGMCGVIDQGLAKSRYGRLRFYLFDSPSEPVDHLSQLVVLT